MNGGIHGGSGYVYQFEAAIYQILKFLVMGDLKSCEMEVVCHYRKSGIAVEGDLMLLTNESGREVRRYFEIKSGDYLCRKRVLVKALTSLYKFYDSAGGSKNAKCVLVQCGSSGGWLHKLHLTKLRIGGARRFCRTHYLQPLVSDVCEKGVFSDKRRVEDFILNGFELEKVEPYYNPVGTSWVKVRSIFLISTILKAFKVPRSLDRGKEIYDAIMGEVADYIKQLKWALDNPDSQTRGKKVIPLSNLFGGILSTMAGKMSDLTGEPIAYYESCFVSKYGVPSELFDSNLGSSEII